MARGREEAQNVKDKVSDDGETQRTAPASPRYAVSGAPATPATRDDAFEGAWDDAREPHDRPL
jgi:hypothetical protein